ncbi:MAG TPA: glycosyltransferase family 9 protein [Kiritimatiellia bacterium]|jgi:ADP-heptose:LPS heptosyltransferase
MTAGTSLDTSRSLLLMINHHVGNYVVSLPFLDAMAATCATPPDILVDERFACLARLLPHAGEIIPYAQQHRRGNKLRQASDFVKLLGRIAGARYRTVFDVGGGIQSVTLAMATLSRNRIGLQRSRRSWAYTERLPPDTGIHASDRFMPFVTRLGLPRPGPLRLRPRAESFAALEALLPAVAGKPFAAFHPGAGYAFRQWPGDRFAQVADALAARHGLRAVFVGAPGEEVFLDGIIGRMEHSGGASKLIAPLDVLLAMLDRARVLISNESGPTHLAATTDTPIVTIFGPSKEANWRPVRTKDVTILRGVICPPECRWGACKNDLRCVMDVSVDDVLQATDRHMA